MVKVLRYKLRFRSNISTFCVSMKLLPGLIACNHACLNSENAGYMAKLMEVDTTLMTYRIENMPSQVSNALGLVFKYLLGETDLSQMLMDISMDNEILQEQEEVEEEEKDIAKIFLSAILNPLESTNRYLQYDFTRDKIEAGKGKSSILDRKVTLLEIRLSLKRDHHTVIKAGAK